MFVSVIILDFSNVISSKMHISIDSWVVALTTSATILFSFWLITDQKKIEKKRMLVAECLHNDFFSLIYSNTNTIKFDKNIGDVYITGLKFFDIFVQTEFISKIKLAVDSGLLSSELSSKCLDFVENREKYFSTTEYPNINNYVYPILTCTFNNKEFCIISSKYFEYLEIEFNDEGRAYLKSNEIFILDDYSVRDVINHFLKIDLNKSGHKILIELLYNFDKKTFVKTKNKLLYSIRGEEVYFGRSNLSDKGYFFFDEKNIILMYDEKM